METITCAQAYGWKMYWNCYPQFTELKAGIVILGIILIIIAYLISRRKRKD